MATRPREEKRQELRVLQTRMKTGPDESRIIIKRARVEKEKGNLKRSRKGHGRVEEYDSVPDQC